MWSDVQRARNVRPGAREVNLGSDCCNPTSALTGPRGRPAPGPGRIAPGARSSRTRPEERAPGPRATPGDGSRVSCRARNATRVAEVPRHARASARNRAVAASPSLAPHVGCEPQKGHPATSLQRIKGRAAPALTVNRPTLTVVIGARARRHMGLAPPKTPPARVLQRASTTSSGSARDPTRADIDGQASRFAL